MKTFQISRLAALCLGLASASLQPALAGQTDLATAPLFTSTTSVVKPNVMFTLDDSGSMSWDYMPDDADFGTGSSNTGSQDTKFQWYYGRRAAQCNGLGYVPDGSGAPAYALPQQATDTGATTATMSTVADASTAFLSGTVVSYGTPNPGFAGSGSTVYTFNQRAITSPSSPTIISSGALTVTVSGNSLAYTSTTYYVGKVVSVFGSTTSNNRVSYDSSKYMIGKVSAWNSSTGVLTINVAMAGGTSTGTIVGTTLSAPYVGDGSPIDNVYYTYTGSQTKMGWAYPGNVLTTSSTFYKECNSAIGSDPGKSVFTANIVTPSSAEAQRYANWYYYYSTRMRMMKTSLSIAFKDLDDKYRIGFSKINESTTGPTLNVADFAKTQKIDFYTKFNAASPSGGTPLRNALTKIGKYYANKITGQVDPVQYSCQKNFSILSTDGYWNGAAGTNLSGNAVGNQDGGTTLRPMYDGGVTTAKTTKTWTTTETGTRTAVTPRTTVSTVTSRVTQTVTTPHTTTTYRKLFTTSISSVARCSNGSSPCTITVTTSTANGYASGDSITISGVSPSTFSGTFTITVTSATTFTYTLSARPSSSATLSSAKSSPSSNSCSTVGQGQLITTVQTYTATATTPTDTTVTTTTPSTSTTVYNLTRTTPMTEVITVVNGVQQSDVTTPGTATITVGSTVSGPTTATGTATNSSSSTTGSTSTLNSTAVTSAGYPTTGSCSATAAPANTDVAGTSSTSSAGPTQTGTTGPTTTNGTVVNTDSYGTPTNGTVTTNTTTTNSGGSSDSLADVAMYYYQTDLRDSSLSNCTGALGTSVCDNNVKAIGDDTALWQHMSTYTLSLGQSGTLTYDAAYQTQSSGDFYDLKVGNKNWPVPSSDAGAVNIDDLWHAAVNGRGRYFSATDPTSLSSALAATLSTITAQVGSSSAAATSTLQPVEGDNGVYIAQFKSSEWVGDVRAYKLDVTTGTVTTSKLDASGNLVDAADWSASDQLGTSTTRRIYYFKAGTGNTGSLREFTYANLSSDGLNGNVDNACNKTPALTQCSSISGTALADVNSGTNMVSFLRGQPQAQYRTRTHVLGDIVNSSPVYVRKPVFNYTENNYATWKAGKSDRAATIYVGANDGMLHAFDATNGTERWAYIPGILLPNLYQLGDQYYESKHQFFVDGTPVIGDVYDPNGASDATKWRTILVGGFNAGGKGYYALDVTDPANPIALWEFKDSRLGYSYGNPIITKRADGTWVVAFTSGYNNADGGGHLFVVNALTGALATADVYDTGEGTSANPSGLGKLNAFVEYDTENLVRRFYAGDLLGNVWRFDIDGVTAPFRSAFKLAQLLYNGTAQPITTQVQLAEFTSNGATYDVVYVGTGQYLGRTDVSSTAQQSIYAIKDTLSSTSLGDVRSTMTARTVATSGTVRTIAASVTMDWAASNGWYVDLATSGERVNVDPSLAFNVLTVAGNIPGNTATDCENAGSGTSWLYQLDVTTGLGQASYLSAMVAGLATVQLPSGKGVTIVTRTDAQVGPPATSNSANGTLGQPRRSSWRELID